ncbi:MAG: hypothetical protein KF779_10310 [Hyphomonadaceae bacterium]|nr:hypothetical protein [Hyphomonadaceae bacterium]
MVRPFEKILEPDERFGGFVRHSDLQPMTLRDHYDSMAELALQAAVPTKITTAFDRARAAYLYAWFSYELTTLAQSQACASLEMALRDHLGARYPTHSFKNLNTCLEKTIADGDFDDFRLRPGHHTYSPDDLRALRELLVYVRNDVAHGTEMVVMPSHALVVMEPCARMIDRIYGVRMP